MDIKIRRVNEKYKQVSFGLDDQGLLDEDECHELATDLITAAIELVGEEVARDIIRNY